MSNFFPEDLHILRNFFVTCSNPEIFEIGPHPISGSIMYRVPVLCWRYMRIHKHIWITVISQQSLLYGQYIPLEWQTKYGYRISNPVPYWVKVILFFQGYLIFIFTNSNNN